MHSENKQAEEIRTIRTRKLVLELSDADVYRLAVEAAKGGISVEVLLQNFIGDLVSGTYSNGSDEREFARRWYDRCWFGGYSETETLLQHLSRTDSLEYALSLWDEREQLLNRLEGVSTHPELKTPVCGSQRSLDPRGNETAPSLSEIAKRERKLREELKKLSDPFGGSNAWDEVLLWRDSVQTLLQKR